MSPKLNAVLGAVPPGLTLPELEDYVMGDEGWDLDTRVAICESARELATHLALTHDLSRVTWRWDES